MTQRMAIRTTTPASRACCCGRWMRRWFVLRCSSTGGRVCTALGQFLGANWADSKEQPPRPMSHRYPSLRCAVLSGLDRRHFCSSAAAAFETL